MTLEKLQILINIYNSLLRVSTKGEDSFVMVDNLRNLYSFIMQEDQELQRKIKEDKNGIE